MRVGESMVSRQHKIDEGQGGWFRQSREHREAAIKGRVRPIHSPRNDLGDNGLKIAPSDHADKRFLVFCDGVGRYSFDTAEEATEFAKRRYVSGRFTDVEVVDKRTEEDVARFG
jgi:hypothetical protein